ncbi:MOSC domain-containing protein [Fulvivirga sp. RKSG066]|nr:MOSC domain-containing protein [Fulvivirga aurantia]
MSAKRYLSQIYIYPIKSLPGIRLNEAEVQEKGLKYDRRWMLVDSDGEFITMRKNRKLLKFFVNKTSLGYDIGCEFHKSTIQIPFELTEGTEINVSIWGDKIKAIEGNTGWNDWFSEALRESCTLVYFPEEAKRPIKDKWQVNNESVSLADGYPYLVIGESSLDRLNQKLAQPLDISRFRPNLVFKGGEPYEEFNWKDFKIGDVAFKGLKPCARCVVTTLDPDTGESGLEPLKTLATQKIDDKVVFGQHTLALEEGSVKVGDEIEINSTKDSPYDPL